MNGQAIPSATCTGDHGPPMPAGYVAWHEEAERRGAAGWVCTRCQECDLWAVWHPPRPERVPGHDENPDAVAVRAFATWIADRFAGGAGSRDQWQELADLFLFGRRGA